MDRNQLEAILNDPASTPEEKAAAQKALGTQADPFSVAVHVDTRTMLAALKVERIADLNEEIYERHCAAHFIKDGDLIVREFRFWVAPSLTFLDAIGMTRREWWKAIHDAAKVANRPEAQAHARHELETRQ